MISASTASDVAENIEFLAYNTRCMHNISACPRSRKNVNVRIRYTGRVRDGSE